LRRADALLAVAEIQKNYLVETEHLPREKIRVIHNGVDTTRFQPAPAGERAALRAELGIGEQDVAVIAVASLKPLKRIDALLTAAARLAQTGIPLRVIIAGDGSERAALEKLAADLGMGAAVAFLGNRDDVNRLLQASDVFVLASRTEAFPNVVLEAMATGLAVVTTDVGSVREMVEPDASALLVNSGDDAALEAALKRLAGDAALRARLGRRGREIVNERFRFDTMCQKREEMFEDVISNGTTTRK
jgi:glycosyltransferase involved in cell wall biosynthesis